MKLAVLAIAILTLTGCKTTLINESIPTYGDRLTIPGWARPTEATKRYYLRAQNYWIRKNIRRGLGLLGRCFEGPFMQLLNAMISRISNVKGLWILKQMVPPKKT